MCTALRKCCARSIEPTEVTCPINFSGFSSYCRVVRKFFQSTDYKSPHSYKSYRYAGHCQDGTIFAIERWNQRLGEPRSGGNNVKVAIIGTSCTGLVSGAILSIQGHDVICVDQDRKKIDNLRNGKLPIDEPGLNEIVRMGAGQGTLYFTTNLCSSVCDADIVFICLDIPRTYSGAPDLRNLFDVAEGIAGHLKEESIVVIQSTVPVGTNAGITQTIQDFCYQRVEVVSNPEFLREGSAVDDYLNSDRVILGIRNQRAGDVLSELYKPRMAATGRPCPVLLMSPESAEITKYAANSLLAMKLSFMNEIANLCEHLGADIESVRHGVCTDRRIGWEYFRPSAGFGGFSLTQDLRALISQAVDVECDASLLKAIDEVNERQKNLIPQKILKHFKSNLRNKKIAVWGLAYKPESSNTHRAPSISLIQTLLQAGATVSVHDPAATPAAQRDFGYAVEYFEDKYAAIQDADGLAVMTSWPEYLASDPAVLQKYMREMTVFDGQNCLHRDRFVWNGFNFYSIGQEDVSAMSRDVPLTRRPMTAIPGIRTVLET
jgi:UDPglucose 6-dehydrogenase